MVGLLVLLLVQAEPATPAGAATMGGVRVLDTATALVISPQAQRFLELQARSFSTEFMGCMIGEMQGHTALVRRIAPADVDPAQSATTHVVPRQTCEGAGWEGTVGVIHSHPTAERCWYFFPGTEVLSSDGQSFLYQPYPIDAIMCGNHVVWISRSMAEHQLPIGSAQQPAKRSDRPAQRGNLVQASGGSGPGS
jgi:hypothetical protein